MIGGLLACSTGSLLSRQSEPTATPTKTPKPTFTVTLTPTQTPIPTNTPLPTNTPTPVTPTNTPVILTATFTPLPTDTPAPTNTPLPPTNTPRPTARPQPRPTRTPTPRPQPTNTPAPVFPFTGSITGGSVNCGTTGIKGTMKTKAGGNLAGITVAVWTDGWEGAVSNPSDSIGNWDVFINVGAVPGTWYVAVVKAETCQPKPGGGGWTAMGCTRESNIVTVVTTAHCTGEGAVQWPEVQFRQN